MVPSVELVFRLSILGYCTNEALQLYRLPETEPTPSVDINSPIQSVKKSQRVLFTDYYTLMKKKL